VGDFKLKAQGVLGAGKEIEIFTTKLIPLRKIAIGAQWVLMANGKILINLICGGQNEGWYWP